METLNSTPKVLETKGEIPFVKAIKPFTHTTYHYRIITGGLPPLLTPLTGQRRNQRSLQPFHGSASGPPA